MTTSKVRSAKWPKRSSNLRGIFDLDQKLKQLEELRHKSENPQVWNNPGQLQKINQEISILQKICDQWNDLNGRMEDSLVLLEMAKEADDEASFQEVVRDTQALSAEIDDLELKKLLSGEMDANSAYLSINSGAGGTEACDWASMLLRMYTRYADKQGFKAEVLEMTDGDGAGIKSVTLQIQGPYAFGFLKAESGVHRLVRISPFDSNARRHTSFASVFAWPEVDDEIKIDIKTEDLKVDTYRAGGAGGQHVNKTDSAVRITHIPTGIVVQCQNERSQHANRDRAMKMLRAALYEKELEEKQKELDKLNSTKRANEWGSQIRSYVMHPYKMVKDHRTDFETSQVQDIMDGYIQPFINAYLKSQMDTP
ncbi:MAG: peptide chain release factor 2 [Bdellovibrionales bacterium]|nr:peptide chain release factor 2 [Bdellovibrionales bacterium]